MKIQRKSLTNAVASEFRKVNQANAEYASLIRELEYPTIRERIRSPPVPLHLVLAGLLDTLLFVSVRFPLHVLKRFGRANANAVVSILRDLRAEFRGDLDDAIGSFAALAAWLWHWAGILGACLWIEAKILGHHAFMGALLAGLYVALVMGLFWLLFAILGG